MGLVYIGLGEVYREQNRLAEARRYLEQGLEYCRPFQAWYAAVTTGVISLARLLAAEGQAEQALQLLREQAIQPVPASAPKQARLEAMQARLRLALGDYAGAAGWASRSGVAALTGPATADPFIELTLARLLIGQAGLEAQGLPPLRLVPDPLEVADHRLNRLHEVALARGSQGAVIEIKLLQALLYALPHCRALRCLAEALNLAEPEGYVRLFVNEGWPIHRLLTRLVTQPAVSIPREYAQTILATFPASEPPSNQPGRLAGDRLTPRELKTLQLLATVLSIADIAAEMTVSASTVRTYAKRIYSKLDVHSRAEAVYRAKALKLL